MRVIIIDNGETKRRVSIEEALRDQARALDLDIELVDDDGASPKPRDFVVYLGSSMLANAPVSHLVGLDGRLLPVIVTPDDARHLPPELAPINAFIQERYGAEWPHGVVDEVLARTFLRRTNRRVFISYRRLDSQAIARQLRDDLLRLGFDVFLDEVSIPPSVDFQRELMAWLADSDLVIVLGSPRFLESKWTMEEIAFAGAANLGILCIAWPAEIYARNATVGFAGQVGWSRPTVDGTEGLGTAALDDEHVVLGLGDLEAPKGLPVPAALMTEPHRVRLAPQTVEKVQGAVLRTRARALQARLRELLPTARAALAAKLGGPVTNGGELGDLVVDGATGKMLVRVVPFRPSPSTLRQVWHEAGPQYSAAALFYSETNVMAPEVVALRWLSEGTHAEPPARTVVYMELGGRVHP